MRKLWLLLAGALLLPAYAADEASFIKDVDARTKKLEAAKKAQNKVIEEISQDLRKVEADWHFGFQDSVLRPALDSAQTKWENAQRDAASELAAHPTPAALKSEADGKKYKGASGAIAKYEAAHKALSNLASGPITKSGLKKVWEDLQKRFNDNKGGPGDVFGSGSLETVGSGGLVCYRVWGGRSTEWGKSADDFWCFDGAGGLPKNAKECRQKWALPPGNTIEYYLEITFPPGTVLEKSKCSAVFGHKPWGYQYNYRAKNNGGHPIDPKWKTGSGSVP